MSTSTRPAAPDSEKANSPIREIGHDEAYELAESLQSAETYDNGAIKIISGVLLTKGRSAYPVQHRVHVVIPAIGPALVLPAS